MSEQLRHKMITFEATPPPAAWEAIAAQLNDDTQYAALATKMNSFEAIPPPAVWDLVASRLNDDAQYVAVATKMNSFETNPPARLWNNIAAALQEQKETVSPAISFRKTLYRVAAAAVITGFFIGGWMVLTNKKMIQKAVAGRITNAIPNLPAVKEKNQAVTDNENASGANEAIVALHDKPVQNNTKKYSAVPTAAPDDNDGPVLKHALVHDLLAYQEHPIVIASLPILDQEGNVIHDMDILTTSNYIAITGPNGQSTRISSKFANVIRYLNGSSNDTVEYLDRVMEESNAWKKRFQEWRSKISQSAFIPSSANFLDIIEFKELIQEKQ